MIMHVRLFALAKDLVGKDKVALDLPSSATVGELRKLLAESYPRLAVLLERSALAVDDEFADDALVLRPDCHVALLPPVSGG